MINNKTLEHLINKKLNVQKYTDYTKNGIQIEGCQNINKIVTGVTASKKLIKIAIKKKAQAIIVHHGYFWKDNLTKIDKIMRNRIKLILLNNINLYCWHFPLDFHLKLGNNSQIKKKLNIIHKGIISNYVWWGYFKNKISGKKLFKKIYKKYKYKPIYLHNKLKTKIKTIGWCSGKGQKFINSAINFGLDAYLTGEVSEETYYSAIESKIHFFSIGHHNSEIGGIKALSQWIKKKTNIRTKFININNPI